MLETFFQRSFAIRRLRHGPLAEHIDLLADRLAAQGYSRVHSRIQLRHIGHFNRWLQQEHISVEQLDEDIIERYWRHFMREKRVRPKDVFALMKLLDLLREQGVTPRRAIQTVPTPRETLLEKYRCYLREERGLAPGTVRIMLPFVDRFLAGRFSSAPFRLRRLERETGHRVCSKAGNRARFGADQTHGHGAPRLFSIPPSLRRYRDRPRRLCPSRSLLWVLHSSEIPSDRQRGENSTSH